MQKVACQSTTVLQQNPMTSPGQPAISHVATASTAAGSVGLPIEPYEFLVTDQVPHDRIFRHVIPGHEDPADMGIEKATLHR